MGRGWVELSLAGDVAELKREEQVQDLLLRRIFRQPEPRRVVLERLRRLVDELLSDTYAKGVLVRLGPLSGGWTSADSIRKELLRLRDGGKQVILQIERVAGNRELLVASAADQLLMPPMGTIAAGGTAAPGLFLKGLLDKVGLTMEVASVGRYKSAPDQFTRTNRSDADQEQTQAIVDALDNALIEALQSGGDRDETKARNFLREAPIVGQRAYKLGLVDGLALDEDLSRYIQGPEGDVHDLPPLPAGRYLRMRTLPQPWRRIERHVGIVRVVGNILDEGPPQGMGSAEAAVEKRVVSDLRCALNDPAVASVILLIDSRGGSVTASDAIWSAVKRLDQEKPVVACFSDVAASGGYYIACGARAIVCSPLTLTGSIGVFSIVPTWPELTQKLGISQDVVKNLENADIYNPWSGFDQKRREHAQHEVEVMYETFLERVQHAREMTRDEAHNVGQGRVWTGQDAHKVRLVDGLGGFTEAFERAKSLAGEDVAERPQIVRAKRPQSRPSPVRTEGAVSPADFLRRIVGPSPQSDWIRLLSTHGTDQAIIAEFLTLWATRSPYTTAAWLWSPVGHS